MTTKRQSKPITKTEFSQDELDQLLNDYATADASLEKISAQMDLEKLKVSEKYTDKIADLQTKKDEAYEKLKAYYESKKEELFKKKKSIDNVFGRIGFAIAPPALKPMKGYTWESCKNLLKEFLPKYVRTKEEVNKEALLVDRENHLTDELCTPDLKALPEEERPLLSSLFAKVGLKIEQTENFYIDLKKEKVA